MYPPDISYDHENPSQSQQSNHISIFVEERDMYIVAATPRRFASHITSADRQMSPQDHNREWSSFFLILRSYTTVGCGTDWARLTSSPPLILGLGLSLIGFCVLRVPFTLDLVGYLAVWAPEPTPAYVHHKLKLEYHTSCLATLSGNLYHLRI
jgi:hypothetical protein